MKYNVLIAEDDRDIVELLKLYLDSNDFNVFSAGDGEKALEIVNREDIAIALVDLMMPKVNGYEFIKNVRRRSNIPIIIISARDMDTDRVLGLDIGADAYITKPFNALEVMAYVRALLRRYYKLGAVPIPDAEPDVITVGELEFDVKNFLLKKNGSILPLTATELKIIAKLMRNPNRVFTKTQLYECINGYLYESDNNTMMVHISNIRSKIEDDPSEPKYIKTIRGVGYKLEKNDGENQ